MAPPAVSLVVATYNRPARLRGLLKHLQRVDAPEGGWEVVVVDDGSPQPLDAIVAEHKGALEVVHLRIPNSGPGLARNAGVAASRGEVLLFTDDDNRPHSQWARRMAAAVRAAPPMTMVGGQTVNLLPRLPCSAASHAINEIAYAFFNSDPRDGRMFAGNNMACRRGDFDAVGGFDPDFVRIASEDRELCDRWRFRGGRLWWDRRALMGHCHALDLRGFWRQHMWYGRGAHRYHQARSRRGSGRMADDMGLHRQLPRLVRPHLRGLGPFEAARLLALLGVWQAANAAGFFAEAWSDRRRRGEAG